MDEDRHEDDLEQWVQQLLRCEPVADIAMNVLDEGELAYVASHPDLDWTTLRAQPDRDAAVRLSMITA